MKSLFETIRERDLFVRSVDGTPYGKEIFSHMWKSVIPVTILIVGTIATVTWLGFLAWLMFRIVGVFA